MAVVPGDTPADFRAVYEDNCCGYTRSEWVNYCKSQSKPTAKREKPSGLTFPAYSPRCYDEADISQCPDEAKHLASELKDAAIDGILILGPCAESNAFTACSIMRAVSSNATTAIASDTNIVRKLKNTYSTANNLTEQGLFDALALPDVLTITNFGTAGYSQPTLQFVSDLLSERIDRYKTTIVTTCLNANALKQKLTFRGDSKCADEILPKLCRFRRLAAPDWNARSHPAQ